MKDPHIRQEDHVQRELVLSQVLGLLEQQGLATTTLDKLAPQLDISKEELIRFWPDREALLYDSLRYHAQQIDTWRRQLLLDETLSARDKILARYHVLAEYVQQQRYPGCLFIAACSFSLKTIIQSTCLPSSRKPPLTSSRLLCCKTSTWTILKWSLIRWS